MFFLTFLAWETTSNPATKAFPEDGFKRVVRIIMVVLLPAPFGPRNPKISPSWTLSEILSTAFIFPNFFDNESISIDDNNWKHFCNYKLLTLSIP